MASDTIVVGPGAIDMVRRLGPTVWGVLTALAVEAEPSTECVVARASVRSLAVDLGLNKDTVARALGRLRQASLVVHVSGHFDVGVYRLTVPADLIGFDSYVNGTAASRQSRRGALAHLQLSLLEAD